MVDRIVDEPKTSLAPERYVVDEGHLSYAGRTAGWRGTLEKLQGVADKFIEFHRSRQDVSDDWDGAFWSWVRNEVIAQGNGAGGYSVTLSGNGHSVNLNPRQRSMLADHPEMDEHIGLLENKVKELASEVFIKGAQSADFASKMRVHYQFLTTDGVIMDVTATMTVAAKPAKPTKEQVNGSVRRQR